MQNDTQRYCTEFLDAGGSGATAGLLQWWGDKAFVIEDIEFRYPAMDVTPPEELAEAFPLVNEYYQHVLSLAEELPEGGGFDSSYMETLMPSEEAEASMDLITKHFFEYCAPN